MSFPVRGPLPGSGRSEPISQPPFRIPILCLITDRTLAPDGSLVQAVAEAVRGGVTMVQLREKDLPTRDLLDLARRLRDVVEPPATLLIHGRADIAFAVGADGVHLPTDGLPTDAVRAVIGPTGVVGRAIHSSREAERYAAEGLDYLELGTIFPSRSHPGGATVGIAEIERAAETGTPILAVGGITEASVIAVITAGASGIAVISAILAAPDPRDAARRLSGAALAAWQGRRAAAGARR